MKGRVNCVYGLNLLHVKEKIIVLIFATLTLCQEKEDEQCCQQIL